MKLPPRIIGEKGVVVWNKGKKSPGWNTSSAANPEVRERLKLNFLFQIGSFSTYPGCVLPTSAIFQVSIFHFTLVVKRS